MANRGDGFFKNFVVGAGFLFRGFTVWRTAPGLMFLGLLPALIVAVLFAAGIIALGINLETLAAVATPYAETWDEPFRTGIRVVVGLSFLAVAILLVINLFTAVTLIVGQPFYERIWRHVEERNGGIPSERSPGFWASFGRGIVDGLRMLAPTLGVALGLLVLGFIPVVGQGVGLVLGAIAGGWFLSLELVGFAFDARGKSARERRKELGARRAMTLGFGVVTYLLFLVPFGAIVVMPAAVAGATMLSRRELGEPLVPVSAPNRIGH